MIKLLITFGSGFIVGLCWGAGIHSMILMSKCHGRHSIWAFYGLVAVALLGGGIIIAVAGLQLSAPSLKFTLLALQNMMFG